MISRLAREVGELLEIDMYKETYYQNIMYHKLSKIPYLSVHKEVDLLYFKSHSRLPFGRGRIDLVIIDAENKHHILELKVNCKQVGIAIKQARRYLENYTYGEVGSCLVVNWLDKGRIHICPIRSGLIAVEPTMNNSVDLCGISCVPTLKKICQPKSHSQDNSVSRG